ncbi:MAG: DUF881 domain-containing protein [Bacillota bacterium]|nr:DUF881 domain-containing protein [Bacillota bacterium]
MKAWMPLIFLFSLGMGFLLVTQSSVSGGQHLYVSASSLDYYAVNIEAEKETIETYRTLLEETRLRLEELESMDEGDEQEAYLASLQSELELYAMASGSLAVQGPGVSILVDDGEGELMSWNVNDILVHDLDLLLILNELKYAGAEAISVNGQRIVDSTSITCSGYTVRINGIVYAPPYEIKAIGDSARLSSVLVGPNGYGTLLSEVYDLVFRLTVENNVVIPAYTRARTYQYAEIAREGEGN